MAHGIQTLRDFVFANSNETDWHKKTQFKKDLNPAIHFPEMTEEKVYFGPDCKPTGEKILIANDDGLPIGNSFRESFGYILPQKAWEMIQGAIQGTDHAVERIGMLWERSFWFVSVRLNELEKIQRKGHRLMLNFSGSLNGEESPKGELSDTRAVCWNTISISRALGQNLFQIKQTKNSHNRLFSAQTDVETACGMAKIFNETMLSLESKECALETARLAYRGEAIRNGGSLSRVNKLGVKVDNGSLSNAVESRVALFVRGDGNSGDTRADLLHGFTQDLTRGSETSKKDVWARIGTSEFGGNANRKANFFATLADDDKFEEMVALGAAN